MFPLAVTTGHLAVLPTDPCTDGVPFRYCLRKGNRKPGYILFLTADFML